MSPLEAAAKAKYQAWKARTGSELDWEQLHELTRLEQIDDQRQALLALAEVPLSSRMMLHAGMALGELMKSQPDARLGDMFVAQWRAVLKIAAEDIE